MMTDITGLPSTLFGVFETQRAAFAQQMYPSADIRRERLTRLLKLLTENQYEIAAKIAADFSCRPETETRIIDVFPSIESVRGARKHLAKWMKPSKHRVSLWFQPAKARTVYQPLGVVGIIVPWNYPLFLAVGPLAGALAAGNRAMIKMSEFTPQFSEYFAMLIAKYFSADEVAVITGDASVAQQFTALPFDHLLFTGSTAVGKQVMRAAAENLTPVTLELGGKSPTIIGSDAINKSNIASLLVGKLINAGQTCVAPDYGLIPIGTESQFVQACQDGARRLYPQGSQKDYSAIINDRQLQRLQALLSDAESKGARVIKLWEQDDSERFMVPRIIVNCTEDMRVMQEEIFGPILPIMSYRALPDAIAFINARPRPLALYYYGDHPGDIDRILHETHAGGVCINATVLHVGQENLPFGGVGASGMGAYHGESGFRTFSKAKGVYVHSRLSTVPFIHPPYSAFTKLLLKVMIRR